MLMNKHNKLLFDVLDEVPIEIKHNSYADNKLITIFSAFVGFLIILSVMYQVIGVNYYKYPSIKEVLFGNFLDLDKYNFKKSPSSVRDVLIKQQDVDIDCLFKLRSELLADLRRNVVGTKYKLLLCEKALDQVEKVNYNPFRLRLNPYVSRVLPDPDPILRQHFNSMLTVGLIEKVLNFPDQVINLVSGRIDILDRPITKLIVTVGVYLGLGVFGAFVIPSLLKFNMNVGSNVFSVGDIDPIFLRSITKLLLFNKFRSIFTLIFGIDLVSNNDNDDLIKSELFNQLLELENEFSAEEILTSSWTDLVNKAIKISKR